MFKQFVEKYAKAYFDRYVYVPDGEEMNKVVEDYTRMGFPGCVGPMEVTHVMWKQCPSTPRHVTLVVITVQVLLFRWYVTILVEFIMYLVLSMELLMT